MSKILFDKLICSIYDKCDKNNLVDYSSNLYTINVIDYDGEFYVYCSTCNPTQLKEADEGSWMHFNYENQFKPTVWKEMLSLFKEAGMVCMVKPENMNSFYLVFRVNDRE